MLIKNSCIKLLSTSVIFGLGVFLNLSPVYASSNHWNHEKVKNYIKSAFSNVSKKELKKVIATFEAESHLRCDAKSKTDDIGVAQINKMHWSRFGGKDALKDCKHNIDSAKKLYNEHGKSLKPWNAYRSGAYKKYL